MAEEGAGERTEAPTEEKRRKAREEGQVARSRDIASVLILFMGFAWLTLMGQHIADGLAGRFTSSFTTDLVRPPDSLQRYGDLGQALVGDIGGWLAPLLGGLMVISLLGGVAQVGIKLSWQPLQPKWSKINPFPKLISTFFSKQAVGQLVGSLLKIGMVGIVVWLTLENELRVVPGLSRIELLSGLGYTVNLCLDLMLNVALALVVIAAADYGWNKYLHESKLKMTVQQIKEEHKEQEGDPQMKGRRQAKARELARNRMMQAVPEADVIINNPTHLSIALRYRQGVDAAPTVIAKGADHVAMQIRRIARHHDIPMVEDVPLARSLYKHVDIGRPVPEQFYRAVAELLAYVYRLRQRRR